MVIIDKAAWQIDGGYQPSVIIEYFKRLFVWLKSKGMLTKEGEDVLEAGIDESVSLYERLVTHEALTFLNKNYDEYIKNNIYGTDINLSILESIYTNYMKA